MRVAKRDETKKSERCPQCGNYVKVGLHQNGAYMGQCRVCHAAIQIRRPSPREMLIKIIPATH